MGWAREREADEKMYLDADAVLECFQAWRDRHGDVHEPEEMEEFQKILALPAADVRENRRGKWIRIGFFGRAFKCNLCGNILDFDGVNAGRGDANFCPNCGADMREDHDG